MRFLYISRQFNRSGYYILRDLINSKYRPIAVLLHNSNHIEELDDIKRRDSYLAEYKRNCIKNDIPLLKFTESIKILSEENRIPVFIRKSLKTPDAKEWISSLKLDLILLGGGWPELIPLDILNIPLVGCLNTHPSLLPEFRGADVHRWQILQNVKRSGVTIHYIDETFDTGHIVGQKEIEIYPQDTPQDLAEKSAKISGELMINILDEHIKCYPNKIESQKQTNLVNVGSYYNKWKWRDEKFLQINWNCNSLSIERLILASSQEDFKYNGPFSYLDNKKWIFRKAISKKKQNLKAKPGTILEVSKEGLLIATSSQEEQVLVTQVQEGSLKGYPFEQNLERALTGTDIMKHGNFSLGREFRDKYHE